MWCEKGHIFNGLCLDCWGDEPKLAQARGASNSSREELRPCSNLCEWMFITSNTSHFRLVFRSPQNTLYRAGSTFQFVWTQFYSRTYWQDYCWIQSNTPACWCWNKPGCLLESLCATCWTRTVHTGPSFSSVIMMPTKNYVNINNVINVITI